MLCESDEMEIDLMEYHQLSDEESRVKTMMSTLDVMATLTKTRQSQQKYVCWLTNVPASIGFRTNNWNFSDK